MVAAVVVLPAVEALVGAVVVPCLLYCGGVFGLVIRVGGDRSILEYRIHEGHLVPAGAGAANGLGSGAAVLRPPIPAAKTSSTANSRPPPPLSSSIAFPFTLLRTLFHSFAHFHHHFTSTAADYLTYSPWVSIARSIPRLPACYEEMASCCETHTH